MADDDVPEGTNDEVLPDGEPQVDERARRLGWVPKEEFKGDPDKWRPADEFLKRGEELLGVARENNRKLQDQMDRMASEMSEVKKAASEFREYASKAEERAMKKARADIEAEMRAAVADADPARFDAAKARLDQVDSEYKPPKQDTAQVAPEVTRWVTENPWFNADPELNGVATAIHGRILRDKPGLSLSENLAEVKAEIARRYPEKFSNARREAPSGVETPGAAPRQQNNKRSYENLPPEARAACDRFVKMIPGYTRDQYVKDYDWAGA